MKECPIDGVRFGASSKKAISEMRDMSKRANWLSTALAGSILSDIFVKNGPIGASYKIHTTDFELLGTAMAASTPILRRKASDLAGSMILLHSGSLNNQEKKFWRCMYNAIK
ncbi:hypothetical protein ACFSJ3_01050 [Corallincola platygyrae]|uniref:Uncharacterized protein n=1 Tax=Corallincola platygyrae TaxID=1193278 RepID=A0ABW4XJV8_9GAMM